MKFIVGVHDSSLPITKFTVLTAAARGAIAALQLQGPEIAHLLGTRFFPLGSYDTSDLPLQRPIFGHWMWSPDAPAEEVVVTRTAHDAVEVHCHGGPTIVQALRNDLLAAGAVEQTSSAWLLQQHTDSIAAAAAVALTQCTTERTAGLLLEQMQGALRRELDILASDFAAANHSAVVARASLLLERAEFGKHLTQPWRVAIVGRPNVGKSSLLNALVGYERAIVFDQPGTTRDVLTVATACEGWPVELFDTAGLRETSDPLEAAGVQLSRGQLESAELLVVVCDATRPLEPDEQKLLQLPGVLPVINKCDLVSTLPDWSAGMIPLCAVQRTGIDLLLQQIATRLVPVVPPQGAGIPFQPDQVAEIERSLQRSRAALTSQ